MHQRADLNIRYDFILVGGGLQSGLIALAIAHEQPEKTLLIIERDSRLGGNHTWCFHDGDVPEAAKVWFDPVIEHRWDGYTVNYPNFSRQLELAYRCISSTHFHDYVHKAVTASANQKILYNTVVSSLGQTQVTLEDGQILSGDCIIDARGPSSARQDGEGYQKFVGLEIELAADHGLTRPVLMDGCVPQTDGLRFFYVLPFGKRRLLVEDTYFSDHSDLAFDAIRAEVKTYARAKGWKIVGVIREERGVLPLPWVSPPPSEHHGAIEAGYRGGYFHPVTGYSLPAAIRLATILGQARDHETRQRQLNQLNEQLVRQRRYLNRLNHVFFRHYEPENRWHLMARFYKRPEDTIRRFYSMELTGWDIARILVGPIPKKMRWTARTDISQENL